MINDQLANREYTHYIVVIKAVGGVSMRCGVIVGLVGLCLVAPAQAQTIPGPFEDMEHIVCADQALAVELLTVFEESIDRGEALLSRLASRDACARTSFSGKPVVDVYTSKANGNLAEGHVFEVEVTQGDVLNGRTRAYMLLRVVHDNET
jgi:hypothetical protein